MKGQLPCAIELPRVDVIHELSEAERTAPDGTLMVVIGQDSQPQWPGALHLDQERAREAPPGQIGR